MILFPNAKINVGLYVTGQRADGYHDVATVMVPIGWSDILEIVPKKNGATELHLSGRRVDCPPQKNLVVKAYHRLSDAVGGLPQVDIWLHKIVPDGAGLGGGSSDAAFMLRGLNDLFGLGIGDADLSVIAAGIGADCPFFIYNRPMLATGIGTDLTPIEMPAFDGKIVVAKPQGSVSTAEAYRDVDIFQPRESLLAMVLSGVDHWKSVGVINAFESSVFSKLCAAADIKDNLIETGAIYASMSGSGSAVYGIFDDDKMAENAAKQIEGCSVYLGDFCFPFRMTM